MAQTTARRLSRTRENCKNRQRCLCAQTLRGSDTSALSQVNFRMSRFGDSPVEAAETVAITKTAQIAKFLAVTKH